MEMIGTPHETIVHATTIAWGEMGAGPPLVLLHGLFDSHRTWRRVAHLLAPHFRVLMPDLPGNGYSGRPDAPYTLSWNAQVVAEWMAAVGVEKAHLCGHSYGGGVAQWMVLEQRARIDRLALVSAGGLGRQVALGMRFAAFPVLGRMITPYALRYGMPRVLKHLSRTFGHMEPEEQQRFIELSRLPGTDRAFLRTLFGVVNFFGQHVQTRQRAGEVDDMPPVALFWGKQDPIIPLRHGRDALAQSENVTLTIYEHCGHYPHLESPEAFARDLSDFLRDPNRRPARFLRNL
ncbi:MAG TPA: alpha/beta fold hydrolase [bacterium]|nr:alpha/beta fold hydrolase [bacterium]